MAKKPSRLQKIRENVLALLDERAAASLAGLSRWHRFAHFCVMVSKSFTRNRCPVRASALAYVTVLALIPMLAVVMSISSAILKKEGEEQIDQFIMKLVASATTQVTINPTNAPPAPGVTAEATNPPAPAALVSAPADTTNTPAVTLAGETNQAQLPRFAQADEAVKTRKAIAHYIHQFIRNTRSGALGVTGSILLVFAAISLLSRIEDTFNDIWGVARGRSWFMRIVLYWGVISLAPMLLIVALGLATGPHLEGTRKLLTAMPFRRQPHLPVPARSGAVPYLRGVLRPDAEHQGALAGRAGRRPGRGHPLSLEQRRQCPLRLARGVQQQDLRQPRPGAGVYDRHVFLLADPAVRRAGGLCVPEPGQLF